MPTRSAARPRHWTQWSEEHARGVLDRLERSGLSLAAFARQQRLSPKRIAWWRRKLAAQQPARSTARPAFVPVQLVAPQPLVLRVGEVSVQLSEDTCAERIAQIANALLAAGRAC